MSTPRCTGTPVGFAWNPSPDLQHPNIFLASLFLTGYVVVRQVKRILLLSRYYEQRQGADLTGPSSA